MGDVLEPKCPPLSDEKCDGLSAYGLVRAEQEDIPSASCGVAGAGGLATASVFLATRDIYIYRLWNSTYEGSMLGKWWSLDNPVGTLKDWRRNNAVCPSWSPLDMLAKAVLPQGAHVTIGTGQSARCGEFLTYVKSQVLQVYVHDVNQLQDVAKEPLQICRVLQGGALPSYLNECIYVPRYAPRKSHRNGHPLVNA